VQPLDRFVADQRGFGVDHHAQQQHSENGRDAGTEREAADRQGA
jgi:hypothetical protein